MGDIMISITEMWLLGVQKGQMSHMRAAMPEAAHMQSGSRVTLLIVVLGCPHSWYPAAYVATFKALICASFV